MGNAADLPEFEALVVEEAAELVAPALSVHVDFVELLADVGESEAVRLVGALKDLLA